MYNYFEMCLNRFWRERKKKPNVPNNTHKNHDDEYQWQWKQHSERENNDITQLVRRISSVRYTKLYISTEICITNTAFYIIERKHTHAANKTIQPITIPFIAIDSTAHFSFAFSRDEHAFVSLNWIQGKVRSVLD